MSTAVDRLVREALEAVQIRYDGIELKQQDLDNRIEIIETKIGLEIIDESPPPDHCKCTSHLEAAIEAVEHVAQANWSGRERAAKM